MIAAELCCYAIALAGVALLWGVPVAMVLGGALGAFLLNGVGGDKP